MNDRTFYTTLLAAYFLYLCGGLLAEVGKEMPSYTFTMSLWFVAVGMSVIPAWLGYRLGRARE